MMPARSARQVALLLFAALLFLAGCSKQQAAPVPPAAPVTVARVVQKTMPVELSAIGSVEPTSSVAVKSQVAGELIGVHFTEGQDVRAGQLLFTIDRRPLEAELRRAEASLARDEAQLKNARAQAVRYTRLVEEGVVAKEQYDAIVANAEALEAAVNADRAAVENARVQLAYTTIYSPVDGRTGSLMVHKGNVVKENDEKSQLVVINRITPIYVSFTLPEQHLAEVRRYMAEGKLTVQATIPQDSGPPVEGVVSFVNNEVDRTTGTIRLKATFPNQDRRLWPGQFVDVRLKLTAQPNAIVIPAQAIQSGQQGDFVFIVKPDQTADSRQIKVARVQDGQAVIAEGLEVGETVVTDGQIRLVPGARVEIKNPPQTSQERRP
ncbi:MAG TPA: efflux RND transporter periplasmic adaptor subunit [Terriglobales bacterium]|nr:efflux RND transporter periplasmic adaptor subunit [Terriglobales bacterium]